MPEICTSSYPHPLEMFVAFFSLLEPALHIKCFVSAGRICIFLDRDKKQGFGEAPPGALLPVASRMEEVTSADIVRASLESTARPKPPWPCSSRSNGFTHK